MGIFDRLGDVLKSYLHDEDSRLFGSAPRREDRFADPDLDAAFEELNDFLGGGAGEKRRAGNAGSASGNRNFGGNAGKERGAGGNAGPGGTPESLRGDFEELGLPFGASSEACKAAYKRLLKLHHPDRHAGHPGNMKKATDKSARINAAYDRIEKWRKTGEGG
jgi:DnaJ-domain-containing protein 1